MFHVPISTEKYTYCAENTQYIQGFAILITALLVVFIFSIQQIPSHSCSDTIHSSNLQSRKTLQIQNPNSLYLTFSLYDTLLNLLKRAPRNSKKKILSDSLQNKLSAKTPESESLVKQKSIKILPFFSPHNRVRTSFHAPRLIARDTYHLPLATGINQARQRVMKKSFVFFHFC